MKKIGTILASLLIVTLLAGCSLHYSSMNGISENKMTANEKIALNFSKGFYNKSRSKQRAAINEYYAAKDRNELFKRLDTGKVQTRYHQIKVIISLRTADKNGSYTLVLLHVKNRKNITKKRIVLVRKEKVEHLYSSKNKHFKKEYKKIRQYMKAAAV
ncbi:MAG: hypothetical protein ABF651_01925 [Sporolactobacillus sp.]